MNGKDQISPRQFTAAAFVSALSPLIRRFPRALAARAGHSAYLAIPISTAPMFAAIAAAYLLFRKRPPGTGLAEVFKDILGGAAGRLLTGIYGLWFLFYSGFLLRSGAERFITTVYSGAGPWVFVCVMALLCGLAAAGRLLPLARAAMLFRPLMVALMLAVALLTVKDLDLSLLLPLTRADILPNCAAALETANTLSVGFFFGFFAQHLERRLTARDFVPWLAAYLGIIALMTVGCIGMFGAELTAKMRYPYFMLVRDLTVLGALERVEPVVIAIWVFSDYILISLLLLLATENLRFCCGLQHRRGVGRMLPLLCTAGAAAVALTVPGQLAAFRDLSDRIVPWLSALFGFGLFLPLLLIGALRKRL